jgi:hypothetical protein
MTKRAKTRYPISSGLQSLYLRVAGEITTFPQISNPYILINWLDLELTAYLRGQFSEFEGLMKLLYSGAKKVPYFSIDNAYLIYNAHPNISITPFDV